MGERRCIGGGGARRKWERASSVAAAYSAKSKPASPVYIPRTGRKGQEGSRGGGWHVGLDVSAWEGRGEAMI